MGLQTDLFGEGVTRPEPQAAPYRGMPGWKSRDTSREAAEAIAPKAMSLRARVYEAIKARPGSPEQLAARLNVPLMNCRPRTAELSRMGLIRDSGLRAKAMGGRKAIVWEIVPKEERGA